MGEIRLIVGDDIVTVNNGDQLRDVLSNNPSAVPASGYEDAPVNMWQLDRLTGRANPVNIPLSQMNQALSSVGPGETRDYYLSTQENDRMFREMNSEANFREDVGPVEAFGHAGGDALLALPNLIARTFTGTDVVSMANLRDWLNRPGSASEGLFLTNREAQIAREEQGVASALGSLAGTAPYIFAGPGGALASGAGQMALRAASGRLAAGTIAQLGAQGAVEGALYNALEREGYRTTLGQPFSAEVLVSNLGGGALAGGVGGAAIGAIAAGAGAFMRSRMARASRILDDSPLTPAILEVDDVRFPGRSGRGQPIAAAIRNERSAISPVPGEASVVSETVQLPGPTRSFESHVASRIDDLDLDGAAGPIETILRETPSLRQIPGGAQRINDTLELILQRDSVPEAMRSIAAMRDDLQNLRNRAPNDPLISADISRFDEIVGGDISPSLMDDFLSDANRQAVVTSRLDEPSVEPRPPIGENVRETGAGIEPVTPDAISRRIESSGRTGAVRGKMTIGDRVRRAAAFAVGLGAEKAILGGGAATFGRRVAARSARFHLQHVVGRGARGRAGAIVRREAATTVVNEAARTHNRLKRLEKALRDGFQRPSGASVGSGWWSSELQSRESRVEAYGGIVAFIESLASNPRLAMDIIEERAAAGDEAYPGLGADIALVLSNQVQYLSEVIPDTHISSHIPGQPVIPPSMVEIDDFMRRVMAIEDPYSIIDRLSEGTLSQVEVDAVSRVYPSIYQDIIGSVSSVYASVASESVVPYQMRLQMSAIIGSQTDPTLNGEMVMMMQNRSAQTTAQAQTQGASFNGSKALRTDLNMDPNTMTTTGVRLGGSN